MDVGAWFSFTPADNDETKPKFPTEAQCDAYIASAENDFEGYTEVAFDESIARHVTVLKWFVERHIKAFFKMRTGYAENYTMQGGSITHQFQPLMYSSEEMREMIKEIKINGKGAAMAIYDSLGAF